MPSAEQIKAICHTKGPARILAGPGSGKTFTVIQRLNYLTGSANVSPEQILCITFTKAAALEMQERYQNQKTAEHSGSVCFGTVHSICYHILKESGEFRQYSLIQEFQKRKLIEVLLTNKGLTDYVNYTTVSELLHALERKKNALPYREEDCFTVQQLEEIYHEYQQALSERQLLDYDDMVCCALTLLKGNEYLRNKWQRRFSYLMVDEFQDINETQYQMIKLLAAGHHNLFVVGDDDQAIYGFRGAAPDIMKQFEKDFPSAVCLYLTENYRSGKKITEFAGKLIQKNINRISKHIIAKKQGGSVSICYEKTRKEEEARLLNDIRQLETEQMNSCALIVRTNIEAAQYIRLLKQHRICVKTKEEKKEHLIGHFIKEDFEAFLQFCKEGRQRRDFLKIMNKPERYLSARALTQDTVTKESLMRYYEQNPRMQEKIRRLFEHAEKVKSMSFSMAIKYFRNIIGYNGYLKERSVNVQEYESFIKIADELQLLCKQQRHNEPCRDFWSRMEREIGSMPDKENMTQGISVLTMHGAKGLEFCHVFLPDVNEGVIPAKQCKSKESIEEERRLLYVAVTRAKDTLHIYYTGERGRKPSRFIDT